MMPINIRELYTPIQPDVDLTNNQISYREYLPHLLLQDAVYCYWQLQTLQQLPQDFTYRVVADGCIDLFFDANQPNESYVMGFCKSFTSFNLGNNFNYIGIRFLPTKLPILFGLDALKLSHQDTPLKSVAPHIAHFIATKIRVVDSIKTICTLIGNFLLEHISENPPRTDSRLESALAIILQTRGMLNLEKDLDVGLSPRQLRRIFETYVGTTPKTFCKVVRFQQLLKTQKEATTRNHSLFLEAGYFDQAHFIKEFKKLYGLTPHQAFMK